MSSVDYQRVREVFVAARRVSGDERERVLGEACAGDAGLRAEVESLLANLEGGTASGGRILDEPVMGSAGSEVLRGLAEAAQGAAEVPERIGQYRVLRLIGEGAMGSVYEAEQESPRRRVALKVLRPGLVSRQVMQRFGREAEILGKLHHPGIAQVFEAGTFGPADRPGRVQPFFAMEFIEGEPLWKFVAEKRLGVRDKLALMARICDAVQHAHERGVIHRDLKPANIMVVEGQSGETGPRPKVLDFGVARAADPDLRLTTVETGVGQIIGTVAYMSPEQARGDAAGVDARSDVYALGVVLYELLAERLPYEVGGRMLHDAVRVIQDSEPERLSGVSRVFRGDVETIVAKALEKEKERRYQSAGALAADIRRYLADEPIVARPATRTYQLRKFARRNKALVGGVAATMGALVVGLVVSTVMYVRAERARGGEATQARLAREGESRAKTAEGLAEAESSKVKAVNEFLLKRMLRSPDPRLGGREVKVIDVLDGAAQQAGSAFAGQPSQEAVVRSALAESYLGLGEFAKALAQAQAAYDLRSKIEAPDSEDMIRSVLQMGRVYIDMDQGPKAEEWLLDAKRRLGARADGTSDLALDVVGSLANAIQKNNRPREAEPILRRVIAAREADPTSDPDDTLFAVNIMGACLQAEKKYEEAETYQRRFYEGSKATYGPEHPSTIVGLQNLAMTMTARGLFKEAEVMLAEAVRLEAKVMGEAQFTTGVSRVNHAMCLVELGRDDEAEREFAEGTRVVHAALGDAYLVQDPLHRYSMFLLNRGELKKAEPVIRELLGVMRNRGDQHGEEYFRALSNHITVLNRTGGCRDAEGESKEAIELAKALYGESDVRVLQARSWLGETYVCLKRYAEAEPLLLDYYKALHPLPEGLPADEPLAVASVLAQMYDRMGKGEEAKVWAKRTGQ